MKPINLLTTSITAAALLLSMGLGIAGEAKVNLLDGAKAKLAGTKSVFYAVTAKIDTYPPFVDALGYGLRHKKRGLTVANGFPEDNASRKGAVTVQLRIINKREIEFVVLDSATDDLLAKINVPTEGTPDADASRKIVNKILDQMFPAAAS